MKNIQSSSFQNSLLVILLSIFTLSCNPDLTIVNNQVSEYNIILPEAADMSEIKAASMIQRFIYSSTGYKPPIMRDREPETEFEICMGSTNRNSLLKNDKADKISSDGYRLVTHGNRLFIYGGSPRGTLNGACSFLEDFIGVRILSSKVKMVPEMKKFRIPMEMDTTYNPPIKFRTTHYRDTWNQAYSDWHKLNHNKDGSHPDWGFWCHSFNTLVPPDEYYENHPEYYAEVNGNRVPTQLCLTNPDVFDITI